MRVTPASGKKVNLSNKKLGPVYGTIEKSTWIKLYIQLSLEFSTIEIKNLKL